MAENTSEDQKNRLLGAIHNASEASDKVVKQGQDLVEIANLQRQVAEGIKQIIGAIPNDSYLRKEEWERRTKQWNDTATVLARCSSNLESNPILFNTAASTTASIGYILPKVFLRDLSNDRQSLIRNGTSSLNTIIENSEWDKKIEQHFRRLRLIDVKPSRKSALRLFQAAHDALRRPSTRTIEASAVLIPARESVNNSLAELLLKRPKQEPAKNTRDKVISIAKQLKYDHIPEAAIDTLSYDAEKLINELSNAKQANLSTLQIHTLFNKTKSFLMAFLTMIDDRKMR